MFQLGIRIRCGDDPCLPVPNLLDLVAPEHDLIDLAVHERLEKGSSSIVVAS